MVKGIERFIIKKFYCDIIIIVRRGRILENMVFGLLYMYGSICVWFYNYNKRKIISVYFCFKKFVFNCFWMCFL